MFINPCNGIITCKTEHGIREVFAHGIREILNQRTVFLLETGILSFGIRNTTQEIRIPLTNGIQNPSSADKDSGTHYLESGIYGVESKIQDCHSFSYMERGDAQSTSSHPHVREGRKMGTQKRNSTSHNYIANILQSKKRLKAGNKEIPY